ncbi:Hint domain-containing protein [Oceanomicrobium pacificus]|uniref:Type I secretion protein n=1 Tax=Oceanomicrobium pacificus TaxID=2692916 RepID=A0A6B0U4J0_9RHOB|nr:Hint domain-containing protein [Oceanomicrobium pacificus]MXU65851.1 type I secretion protein [Oceanomicrobium pacificus]
MADPAISEIKYLGSANLDMLEVRIPSSYTGDPANLRLVIYDRSHDGSTTASPAAGDIYTVTDGQLTTGNAADHYVFGANFGTGPLALHREDAVGLYDAVTGETFGLYSFGTPYTASTATGDPFAGQAAQVLDTTGQVIGSSLGLQPDGSYVFTNPPTPGQSFVCFTKGALIDTQAGPRAIETLAPGDMVLTWDDGPQPLRWIGSRTVALSGTAARMRPVRIRAHAFGPDTPSRDLIVSPQHRMLVAGPVAQLYFDTSEVLAPAAGLVGASGVLRDEDAASVTYWHMLFDRHQIVMADGVWSESLFLGDLTLDMLQTDHVAEVLDLFPELRADLSGYGPTRRLSLTARETRVFLPG